MSKKLILGIYTLIEWHEMSKPTRRCACGIIKKDYASQYGKWYRDKQKLLKNKA